MLSGCVCECVYDRVHEAKTDIQFRCLVSRLCCDFAVAHELDRTAAISCESSDCTAGNRLHERLESCAPCRCFWRCFWWMWCGVAMLCQFPTARHTISSVNMPKQLVQLADRMALRLVWMVYNIHGFRVTRSFNGVLASGVLLWEVILITKIGIIALHVFFSIPAQLCAIPYHLIVRNVHTDRMDKFCNLDRPTHFSVSDFKPTVHYARFSHIDAATSACCLWVLLASSCTSRGRYLRLHAWRFRLTEFTRALNNAMHLGIRSLARDGDFRLNNITNTLRPSDERRCGWRPRADANGVCISVHSSACGLSLSLFGAVHTHSHTNRLCTLRRHIHYNTLAVVLA